MRWWPGRWSGHPVETIPAGPRGPNLQSAGRGRTITGEEWTVANRGTGVPLVLLDVAIGVAAAGLSEFERRRDEVRARAGAATAPAQEALRRGAERLRPDQVRRLRVRGRARRLAVEAAVQQRLSRTVPRVLDGVLDQVDLTALVERRLDLDRLAGRLDLDAVLARLDLVRLAGDVVDGIDLPGIIRDSTGSMASDGISGVRMQSAEADEAVAHFVDRVFRRRSSAPAPITVDGVASGPRLAVPPPGRPSTDGAGPVEDSGW